MLIDEILGIVEKKAAERNVEEVVVGVSYTGVKLDEGCGVAYTLSKKCFLSEAGNLTAKKAKELARLSTSPEPLPSSIGVAAINAILEKDVERYGYESGNLLDFIEITRKDVVGIIGFFPPLIKEIKKRAGELYIFERKEINGAYPDWAIYRLLPNCSIVIITASTIINKTIDSILTLTRSYSPKEVCITGASTPLLPEVFKKYGVSILAGIKVNDTEKLMKIIKEGGGARNFGRTVEKIILR